MIPKVMNSFASEDFQITEEPSKTFRMGIDLHNGIVDGLESVKQAIYNIMNTERYQYPIFSWDYGMEIMDLIGQDVTYVCPELERRIIEALTMDDRIVKVDSFSFDIEVRGVVRTSFTVHTVFGNADIEKEVNI